MPLHFLSSAADPCLDRFANLQGRSIDPPSKSTSASSDFVVEGRFCVKMLAESSLETIAVVVQMGREEEVASWFPPKTEIYVLSRDQIESVVGFAFHRGMLAIGRRPLDLSVQRLTVDPEVSSTNTSTRRVILAAFGISDRDNLGSLLRTAAGFGVREVIVDPRTVDPFSRRVVRVSMATVLSHRIYRSIQPLEDLRRLTQFHGFRTLATTPDGNATPIQEWVADDRPVILLVGNEGDGLDSEIIEAASDRVTIPMSAKIDSFNVSIAAAIFLHELHR